MANKQPEALRLADALREAEMFAPVNLAAVPIAQAAAELRRLHALNAELLRVLQLAVRQNSHDMLMTGEELRQCEAAILNATKEGN